jgi:hypothetical protein
MSTDANVIITATGAANASEERIASLEGIIERHQQTVIEVGNALEEIRERQLYREEGFRTFEDYWRAKVSDVLRPLDAEGGEKTMTTNDTITTATGAATATEEDRTSPQTSKLSKLQKQILALALANRVREGRDEKSNGADLFYSQILAEVYGFPTTYPLRLGAEHPYHPGMRICGQHVFDVGEIGKGRYNAAQAAISRAMARLQSRGLVIGQCGVTAHWSGCNLTVDGMELAKRLTQT